MSGPPPKDPQLRRRRNATPGFKLLPHEGRTGPVPPWPLPPHPAPQVAALETVKWAELWALPQAVEWERMQDYGTVALYVRVFCEVAAGIASGPLLSEVRQLDAKIGLSPKAMRDLRWETDEPVAEEPEAPAPPPRRVRAVDRGT